MIRYILNFFSKIYETLVPKRSPIIIDSNLDTKIFSDYFCELNFRLSKTSDEIDIEFLYPDSSSMSVEDISKTAESCANLIVCINSGLLKKQITKLLIDHKKHHMNNDKTTLLLDNILFFQKILNEELANIKKTNGPLIKPSTVFRSI